MQYYSTILEAAGHTPLIRLSRATVDTPALILAKLESLNPGGSIKDRIGIALIEDGERRGLLREGGTIVEPTSGNTGHGLAIAAALRGYRMIFTMPDKMAPEKISLLQAYGAEVVICPTNVEKDSPESYYSVAARLAAEIPGAYQPNQYANPANPETHYRQTGPEIWEQTDGKITTFVAGMGTGGTISGISRYLKEKNPDIRVIGADPDGSIYSGEIHPYSVEGIGEDFFPETMNLSLIDRIVQVSDRDSFATARQLVRREGLLVGGSSGSAVAAVRAIAPELSDDDVVVVILPDSGRSYLSKFLSDSWLRDNGYADLIAP